MAEIIRMPLLSDTMQTGTILRWHKKEGDTVKRGELLAEIESDKAAMEFESPASGILLKIIVPEGETAPVQSPIAIIGSKEEADKIDEILQEVTAQAEKKPPEEKVKESPKEEELPTTAELPGEERVKASPLAKKLAREHGIDLRLVKGTGPQGRIVKRDIEAYLKAKKEVPAVAVAEEEYEDVPVTSMRMTIARRLQESFQQAPHYYLTVDVNADRLVEFHQLLKSIYPDEKISINDVLMKLVAEALKLHPEVNARWQNSTIRRFKVVHLGFAVAIEEGLVVPVIKYADRKTIIQISREAKELIEKARNRKLTPEEMQGSTFTISNLGMFGIESFTAVINPPEAAILAVGKVRKVPVVDEQTGQLRAGLRLKLTMSCDHRVIDGAMGARFLQTLSGFIEEPALVLAGKP